VEYIGLSKTRVGPLLSGKENAVSRKESSISRAESSGNGLCPSHVVDTLGIELSKVSKDRLLNVGD
jgi:hypothetical protein